MKGGFTGHLAAMPHMLMSRRRREHRDLPAQRRIMQTEAGGMLRPRPASVAREAIH